MSTQQQRQQWRTLAESIRLEIAEQAAVVSDETDARITSPTWCVIVQQLRDAVLALTAEPESGPVTRDWMVETLGEPTIREKYHDHWMVSLTGTHVFWVHHRHVCTMRLNERWSAEATREQIMAVKHLADTLKETSPWPSTRTKP